ncbi:hypothetical protein M413DRAFT_421233 [Hebeloma cylindrosporum]|uniref:Uncharacterized protein n=1 Tax=Hebeloma cylindrosporum TaxID=76867 RepID=A0A0C3C0X6_HEBCY|nr:hypothetical protein M413DRAFT_421233 [Hebeloma cylindrosporum h7]
MAPQTIIISSDGSEGLAPKAAQPRQYPRQDASPQEMSAHPDQATGIYNSFTQGSKPAEKRKQGEQMKGAQCKGSQPQFQTSGQENRAVDPEVHAKAMEGGGDQKKRHECEEHEEQSIANSKQTRPISFDSTQGVFGKAPIDDDANWVVIDYPEEQLSTKQTVSLSFDPTHGVSGEAPIDDDASWEDPGGYCTRNEAPKLGVYPDWQGLRDLRHEGERKFGVMESPSMASEKETSLATKTYDEGH